MARTYIDRRNGRNEQINAIDTFSGNPNEIIATDATGRIDETLLPIGVGADTYSGLATETLLAGAFVYITATGDVANADASSQGKEAIGYVLSAFTSGQQAIVYFEDLNDSLTGLVPGSKYWLSATVPGQITSVPPTGAGIVSQYIGTALNATTLRVLIEPNGCILV